MAVSRLRTHPIFGIIQRKRGTIAIKDEVEGITFYFDDRDSWFLENYDLKVAPKNDDVEYIFTQHG